MTNEIETNATTTKPFAADGGAEAIADRLDGARPPVHGDGDAANGAPANIPDTSRAGARADGGAGLIDHTSDGNQTLEADGNVLRLGAEIPMRGISLPDLDQPAQSPAKQDPRVTAREALSELAAVEAHIESFETRKRELRKTLAIALAEFGPEAEDQKLVTPFGSASLNDAPRRARITNESAVPSEFKKFVVDEKKIGDALRAGDVVAGAELSNGGDKVVRVTWPKSAN